jgi:hypothetical protein
MSRPSIDHLKLVNEDFINEVLKAAKPYVAGADLRWVKQQQHKFVYSIYFCVSGNVPPRYEIKFNQVFENIKEKYERKDKLFQ